tara:strand:- start:2112 stop:2642 length:531 start_codon:yes stop_codon:yes gene_type:complete
MIIKIQDIKKSIIPELSKKIFIYPTDTIYGIGCNAENIKNVEKIRKIKRRDRKPLSIIAPSISYILKNFEVNEKIEKFLPGPYTLILKKKKKEFLKHISDTEYIGVRIPNHVFTKFIQKTQKPIITTSVNFSGEKPANSIKEINKDILKKVDFVIDAGVLSGHPSKIIRNGKIIER